MRLFASIGTEPISGVHLEPDQPSINVFAVLPQIGRLGIPFPLNLCAIGIDQSLLHPAKNDFLVELWVRATERGVGRWSLREAAYKCEQAGEEN